MISKRDRNRRPGNRGSGTERQLEKSVGDEGVEGGSERMYLQQIIKHPDGTESRGQAVDLGTPADWKTVHTDCRNDVHDMQPDDSDPAFHAEKCSNCGVGRLIRPRAG